MTSPQGRETVAALIDEATAAGARLERACGVLGLAARTVQRWRSGDGVKADRRPARVYVPPHKLSEAERAKVLAVANSPEFGHLPPCQIVPRLADRGEYLASESTFYRILKAENQLAHRRAERPGQARGKPRALCATAPNQVYCWDITYLPAAIRGRFFYLYLFLDLFSRKVVGWQVYGEESSALAGELLRDVCRREGVAPGQVVLHSDNGGPMKGSTMLATLQSLGVAASFSRPAVSNDNPYAEAVFKTLKYRPDHPVRPFDDLAAARRWAEGLVQWYNHEHRHGAIRFVTPAERHAGHDADLLKRRRAVYEAARARHPQRWTGGLRNWRPIPAVHLNPERSAASGKTQPEVHAKPPQTA